VNPRTRVKNGQKQVYLDNKWQNVTSDGTNTGKVQYRIGAGILKDTTANTARGTVDEFRQVLVANPAWATEAYAATHGGKTTDIGVMINSVVTDTTKAQGLGMTYAQYHSSPGGAVGDGSGAAPSGSGDGGAAAAAAQAAQNQSALSQIKDAFHTYGLDNLVPWAWSHISDPNNPRSVSEILVDMQSTPEYNARFPGIAKQVANGQTPMTPAEYIAYEQTVQQTAKQVGIPANLVGSDQIATLLGGNVSATEVKDRMVNGWLAAKQTQKTRPEIAKMLSDYYGVTPGHLAAYWLNPQGTYETLMQHQRAATIGAIGVESSFGKVGVGTAEKIVAQPGMSDAQAQAGFEKIATLTPLEQAQVGQRGQATVSKQQLLGSAFGGLNKGFGQTAAGNASAIQLAEEARVAGLQAGGGFTQTAAGGVGVGRAGTAGQGK
jgi:hypothetical protein